MKKRESLIGYASLVEGTLRFSGINKDEIFPITDGNKGVIDQVIRSLDDKEPKYSFAKIIRMAFALDGILYNDVETGKELGISGSYVGQLKQKSLRMLRHPSRGGIIFLRFSRSGLERIVLMQENSIRKLTEELEKERKELQEYKLEKTFGRHWRETKIEDLEFSVRTCNCLTKEGRISTLQDLLERPEEDLESLKNFGKYSLNEVNEFLSEYGLKLAKPKKSFFKSNTENLAGSFFMNPA